MERRKFLGVLGGSALTGLSGCIDIDNGNNLNSTNNSTDKDNLEELATLPDETVTNPKYNINFPGNEESEWNPDYLGEFMSDNGDVKFNAVNGATVISKKLSPRSPNASANEFAARTFSRGSEYDGIITQSRDADRVNFIDNFMLVVESGYVSPEISQVWQRIERTKSGGYRLFGYYRKPFNTRPSLSTKVSIFEVPRIENRVIPDVTVSLVVSKDHMINYRVEEGVVSVDELF
jgi:hypothetical protein